MAIKKKKLALKQPPPPPIIAFFVKIAKRVGGFKRFAVLSPPLELKSY